MRKFIAVAALLGIFGTTAYALTQRYLHSNAAGTANPAGTYSLAAPSDVTPPITEGMLMDGIKAFRISTCAASILTDGGITYDGVLDGTGTVNIYLYNPDRNTWSENVQLKQNVDATGVCEVFPDLSTDMYAAPGYRLYARPVTVGYTRGDAGGVWIDAVKSTEVK